MVRRDEFIAKLAEYNDNSSIESAITGLESYVDEQILSKSIIIDYINSVNAGISSTSSTGIIIETVTELKPTNDIHRDINVTGGTEKVGQYSIWNDDLKNKSNNSVVTEPWLDRTIYETDFDSEIRIVLPIGTNKNVALKLVQKYLAIEEFNQDKTPSVGYWSSVVRPNNGTTNESLTTIDTDSVRLEYNKNSNQLMMIFKLF